MHAQVSVPICVFVFDLMMHNGETLLSMPLSARRSRLLRALPGMRDGYVQTAVSHTLAPGTVGVAASSNGRQQHQQHQQHQQRQREEQQAEIPQLLVEEEEAAEAAAAKPAADVAPLMLEGDEAAAAAGGPSSADAGTSAAEDVVHSLLLRSLDDGAEGLMLKHLVRMCMHCIGAFLVDSILMQQQHFKPVSVLICPLSS